MIAKHWRKIWLGIYSLMLAAMMLDAGSPTKPEWLAGAAPFLGFAIAPIALLAFGRRFATVRGIVALVIGVLGLWLIVETLYFAPPDGQSALVFVFVPVLQLCVALPTLLVTHIVGEEEELA